MSHSANRPRVATAALNELKRWEAATGASGKASATSAVQSVLSFRPSKAFFWVSSLALIATFGFVERKSILIARSDCAKGFVGEKFLSRSRSAGICWRGAPET
jgi:hypothetical protein